jgi:diguanylate cyclase (GGDEF)-like protein
MDELKVDTTVPRGMKRASRRAIEGVIAAIGAPAGWLLIRYLEGVAPRDALAGDPALFVYMTVTTALAFAAFGYLLGEREDRLVDANRSLGEMALTDSLTGLRNPRYFYTRFEEELATARREGVPLAVVVLDLDYFKQVNDRYGHSVGDDVLVAAGRAIGSVTREGETSARVGGEEFAILLPGDDGPTARAVAERVRHAIQAERVANGEPDGEEVRVTASAGVASTAELPDAGIRELYAAADEALYRAKRKGRNRTEVAVPSDSRAEVPRRTAGG